MEFLLNDCSLEGQFSEPSAFYDALATVMRARKRLDDSSVPLRCNRNLSNQLVSSTKSFREFIQGMPDRDQQRAVMSWLTKQGPFWEDDRVHQSDDWLEVDGRIVTDSGVAEAALSIRRGHVRTLLSFEPSSWLRTPIQVLHRVNDGTGHSVAISNTWTLRQVNEVLSAIEQPIQKWSELPQWARRHCPHLNIAEDVVSSLNGHPFQGAAVKRIQELLGVLDRLKACFDSNGVRTPEGQELYQNYFARRDNALITDASESEKTRFREKMTFSHPGRPGEALFCPWHCKVRGQLPIRIHFSYPISHQAPLYVVYIGPKLTRR
ncbi:hypothetical protein [Haliangium sp.]|uniref:hypothetical protein n=1 Tax=Haliangium sp. TaxID=2663208 RepID=UPI003D11B741